MTIRLASASATRQVLLRNAGLDFSTTAAKIDERIVAAGHPRWSPRQTAAGLSQAKAEAVSIEHPRDAVIGADQVLAFGNAVFGKPASMEECRQQLMTLRGKTHQLISAVCCVQDGKLLWTHMDIATMSMRTFSDEFLAAYLERLGSDCLTSVGGYKIESLGIQLFEKVDGDHFTILGLPLLPLLAFLRKNGYASE